MIYLDYNATCPTDPRVVEAMLPYLRQRFGDPSSHHALGSIAAEALRRSASQLAELLSIQPGRIIFTSGGTEANNLAIFGTVSARKDCRHLVATAVEHPSVLGPFRRLTRQGYELTIIDVDHQGRLDLEQLRRSIRDDTALVSVMYANDVTGVLFEISAVAELVHRRRVPLHVDAAQAVGRMVVDLSKLDVDLLSLSGHKFGGPKGVGALYVAPRIRIKPLMFGGEQQRGLRPGTENVAGIVGLGAAAEIVRREGVDAWQKLAPLRNRLETEICRRVESARIVGDRGNRLPNTTCVAFEAVDSHSLTGALSEAGVAVSSASASCGDDADSSHVLAAMGVKPQFAVGAVRFSLGPANSADQIERVIDVLPRLVEKLRGVLPGHDAPPLDGCA